MSDDQESAKKKNFEVKERILVIARAGNAMKRKQETQNFEKKKTNKKTNKQKTFKFTKKLFEGKKKWGHHYTEREFGSVPSEKIYRPTR